LTLRVLQGIDSLPDPERGRGCVATVGVFDGVHLGHFHVLRRVVEKAKERAATPVMVTFSEHPKEVLTGHAPPTVTSLDHRLLLFERAGIATTLVLEFDESLRQIPADAFVREILLDGLGLRELVFGFDSKFGKDRGGNPESLGPLAREMDFAIHEVAPLRLGGRAVSSSAIREAVQLGELKKAAVMLGRPVGVLGTVIPGEGRGREVGFATANLDLHHELKPPGGVYAAFAMTEDGELRPAMVNIGTRPSFGEDGETVVEVHILDFEADLYGSNLEVFFLGLIRDEVAFPDSPALAAQLEKDALATLKLASKAPSAWRIPGAFLPIEGSSPNDLG